MTWLDDAELLATFILYAVLSIVVGIIAGVLLRMAGW